MCNIKALLKQLARCMVYCKHSVFCSCESSSDYSVWHIQCVTDSWYTLFLLIFRDTFFKFETSSEIVKCRFWSINMVFLTSGESSSSEVSIFRQKRTSFDMKTISQVLISTIIQYSAFIDKYGPLFLLLYQLYHAWLLFQLEIWVKHLHLLLLFYKKSSFLQPRCY